MASRLLWPAKRDEGDGKRAIGEVKRNKTPNENQTFWIFLGSSVTSVFNFSF